MPLLYQHHHRYSLPHAATLQGAQGDLSLEVNLFHTTKQLQDEFHMKNDKHATLLYANGVLNTASLSER